MDTETYEKMISGQWYQPANLAPERLRAQTICADYNNLRPVDDKRRGKLLRDLLGSVAENVCVEQPFHCDYGRNITLGPRTFLNYGCVMLDCAPITLGEHVLVGPGCHFYTAIHPLDAAHRATALWLRAWNQLGRSRSVMPEILAMGMSSSTETGSTTKEGIPSSSPISLASLHRSLSIRTIS